MAYFVVHIEVVLPSQTEATHAPFMDGETITLTVNTAPVGGIAIIPWLVPLALRHNTVPIGKGEASVAWSVTSKIVPAGQTLALILTKNRGGL